MGIREAKAELKAMRNRINDMNTTQQVNFFKPFSPRQLEALAKAVDKALDSKKQAIINSKKKKVEALQREIEELEKKAAED